MGFDLATARPVEETPPQPAAAAPAAGAGFDPSSARPVGGLAMPQQPAGQIPGVDPQWAAGQAPAQLEQARRAQYAAQNPVAERVRSAIEGALDIVAKIGGGSVGGLLGLATTPFNSRTAEQNLELGAQAGVEGVRKGYGILGLPGEQGPTTATGESISGGVDQMLSALPPVVGVHGTLAGPALNAGAAVRQVAAPVVQVAQRGVEAVGGAAQRTAAAARGLAGRAEAVPTATPGTQGSAGAAGVDMATLRRERARGLPVPFEGEAALTEGQATRSFEAQRFERETAKDPDLGKPLRQRAAAQNEAALRNLDALESFTGAKKTERGETGQVVVDAIAEKAAKAKKEIDAAYSEARDAGDMAEPIDVAPLARWIDENRSSAGNAGVIGTAEAELQRLGGAQKAGDGSLVPYELSLNDLEELRKKIVAGGKKDATNAHFAGEINKVIDAATEGKGGDLYKEARAKFKTYQAEFKERGAIRDLIGIKKGTSDRITATEKVLERAMRSTDDLRNVRETLVTAGDGGVQAWREVQGQAVRKLRAEITGGAALDERGNPIISPAKLKRTIDAWDADGRLEVLFGKKGAETMRDLRDVGQDLFTAPPGSVNTSNTASVIAKWMADSAASFVATGVPAPLIGLTKAAWKVRGDRKVKKQIEAALGPKETARAAGETPNPFQGSDTLPPSSGTKPGGPATGGARGGTKPPAGETAAVPDDPRLQEIARLKAEQAGSPETVRVLEAQEKRIAAELRAGVAKRRRETDADALEAAAASTFEPAVRQSLLARAAELRDKLPTGQATELSAVPVAKPERTGKIPVGQAKEVSAAPTPAADAPKPTRRERELQRLRDEATDPEVVRDLDGEIRAEQQRAANERRGAEYLRLADAAQDPELRTRLEAKAQKLGVTRPAADEKIPVPEATELDVQTVADGAPVPTEAPAPAAPVQLPDAEVAAWTKQWGFGSLDAQAARDVREAMRYDATAVEQAAQQHARSPGAFTRALQRIIEEGKARESETERPGGGSQGPDQARGGPRGEGPGGQDDGGTPVEPSGGRPRAPDGPGGGAGAQGAGPEVAPAAAPAERAPLPGPVGSATSVVTERGLRVPVRYRLASVDDLITSHSDDLKVNPAFPQEFQPRDRTRASSEAQITRIQNALQPELLAESHKASDGAPIVGPDGLVESGNARTIALRRAYAGGQADAYRAWLQEHAERFGLTPEQVRSTDRPVLVRERTAGVDRADFARQANEVDAQGDPRQQGLGL